MMAHDHYGCDSEFVDGTISIFPKGWSCHLFAQLFQLTASGGLLLPPQFDAAGAPSSPRRWPGGFYNFTIITNDTYQIITLRMTPTIIPAERSLSFIFTTFADVARHASCTRWHPVSRLKCNVLPAPDLLLSPLSPTAGSRSSSHFHVGLTRQLCLLPPAPKPLTPRRQPTATHAAVPELTHGQATHATGAELAAGRPHQLQLGPSTPWPGHLHRQAKLAGPGSGRPPLAS